MYVASLAVAVSDMVSLLVGHVCPVDRRGCDPARRGVHFVCRGRQHTVFLCEWTLVVLADIVNVSRPDISIDDFGRVALVSV